MPVADGEEGSGASGIALQLEVVRLQARVEAFMDNQAKLNAACMETEKEQWKAINQLKLNTAKWSAAAAAIGAVAGGGIPKLLAALLSGS